MHRFLASFLTLSLIITLSPTLTFANQDAEEQDQRYIVQLTWKKPDYKNNEKATNFSGSIQSDNLIYVEETLRFESNDSIENKSGNKINYQSYIRGGTDGLVLNITDKPNSNFTISGNYIGEHTISFKSLIRNEEVTINNLKYSLEAKLLNQTESIQDLSNYSQSNPYILEVTWGDLRNLVNKDNISRFPTYIDGEISATNGTIKIVDSFLFEEDDQIKPDGTWNSSVHTHKDGFVALVTPTDNKIPQINIKINRENNEIKPNSNLSTFNIHDNYYIEARKISTYQEAPNSNKLKNKIAIKNALGTVEQRFTNLSQACKTTIQEINNYSFVNENDLPIIDYINNSKNIETTDISNIEFFCTGLQSRFSTYKNDSLQYKYNNNLIPFLDTDDNQWYTPYIANLKNTTWNNKKVVEGFKDPYGNPTGKYGPDQYLKLGEVLKITMILGNHQELLLGSPADTMNHWAGGYLGRARQLQFQTTKDVTTYAQLNNPATRGQAFLLLTESLGMIDENSDAQTLCSNLGFQDTFNLNLETAAACILAQEGIISGSNNRLNLDDPINRAEIAKVVINTINIYLNGSSNYQADDLSNIDPDGTDTNY